MRLDRIDTLARGSGLTVMGALHPGPEDGAPPGAGTLVLLGPDGVAFWETFRASPENRDGVPDPIDRWSTRVIVAMAARLGAIALFPFTGPPWLPFTAWARRTGAAWDSPVGMLVHRRAGLFVSFRGALALPARLPLPAAGHRPCDSCAAPCRTACPANAFAPPGYDVAACHGLLETAAGRGCMARGCAVRRACPIGQTGRGEEQSAFHMAAFHATRTE
jgi:epoxyqueuosine reductase